ncbi:unnamed protein product [Ceutorhynchus assimilis]|uniref:YqaJ viral recombinase domain-containing protein n=1 Tax=Ceutorhynchus assimilis TaxID=467358 RepID=A0A9N9QBK5_9CUCU|nr:unnamed protein product [Ceutorhynchus assimilis]
MARAKRNAVSVMGLAEEHMEEVEELPLAIGHQRNGGYFDKCGASSPCLIGQTYHGASCHNRKSILEVKCPCSIKANSLEENTRLKTFCMSHDQNKELRLETNHDYFYQIQGQMLITAAESPLDDSPILDHKEPIRGLLKPDLKKAIKTKGL